MATLLAHIRVHAGMEERFERIASRLHAATHATEARVRRYEYYRGAEPGSYYSLLAFDDFLAFLEHQTSSHHEASSPELGSVIADLRLEWLDPIESASELGSTDMQELPADASDLARRYHALFAADVRDWWLPLR